MADIVQLKENGQLKYLKTHAKAVEGLDTKLVDFKSTVIKEADAKFAKQTMDNVYLAEGIWALNSTQKITPKKLLSDCRVGWMLIFDTYASGVAKNNDYTVHIIPANFLGITAIPVVASNGNVTYKHVRITNGQIIGMDGNNNSNSMTVVLRYVKEV